MAWGAMAEGDKGPGEEHREAWDKREARRKAQLGEDNYDGPMYPREPVNCEMGTCPWCDGRQAQIEILQDDPHYKHSRAGRVRESIEGGKYVGDAEARVCLTCGRVELADSKPRGSTTQT